jgi:hypothetical protein
VFVEVGAIGVRYDPKLHEGDASYEWFGDLTLRCGDRTERPLELRKRGMELGGTAVLFQAGAGEPLPFRSTRTEALGQERGPTRLAKAQAP